MTRSLTLDEYRIRAYCADTFIQEGTDSFAMPKQAIGPNAFTKGGDKLYSLGDKQDKWRYYLLRMGQLLAIIGIVATILGTAQIAPFGKLPYLSPDQGIRYNILLPFTLGIASVGGLILASVYMHRRQLSGKSLEKAANFNLDTHPLARASTHCGTPTPHRNKQQGSCQMMDGTQLHFTLDNEVHTVNWEGIIRDNYAKGPAAIIKALSTFSSHVQLIYVKDNQVTCHNYGDNIAYINRERNAIQLSEAQSQNPYFTDGPRLVTTSFTLKPGDELVMGARKNGDVISRALKRREIQFISYQEGQALHTHMDFRWKSTADLAQALGGHVVLKIEQEAQE